MRLGLAACGKGLFVPQETHDFNNASIKYRSLTTKTRFLPQKRKKYPSKIFELYEILDLLVFKLYETLDFDPEICSILIFRNRFGNSVSTIFCVFFKKNGFNVILF